MADADRHLQHYVDGQWVAPLAGRPHQVIGPASEEAIATISLGSAEDVRRAAAAARRAFPAFAAFPVAARADLLDRIIAIFKRRLPDLAAAISDEMGAPMWLAAAAQAPAGLGHFMEARRLLDGYAFEWSMGTTRIVREPIGVCGLITPWNWPINQIACKVAPALAAGCAMVLKPSEQAPLSAIVFTEILDEAGVPPGVFNLVQGDGEGVGAALGSDPDIDMVSFTGSGRAGASVARGAAATFKRVSQELGGKSANILLDDADFPKAVASGVGQAMRNSGQSCNAFTRMLVPRVRHEEAVALAVAAAQATVVAAPREGERGSIGPLSSLAQFERVQSMIEQAIADGARLACGGPGRPEGLERGYYARPTIFADVPSDLAIARDEVFGPVLCIIPYDGEDDAVAIANDSVFGLAGSVHSASLERARSVARRLRTGGVNLNDAPVDIRAPFGGYRQSGNGREWGVFGLEEFLEVKAIVGWGEA